MKQSCKRLALAAALAALAASPLAHAAAPAPAEEVDPLSLQSAPEPGAKTGAAGDTDPLALQSAAEPVAKAPERSLRVFGELAVGRIARRYDLGAADLRRASIDANWSYKPAPGWRLVLSDRLDDLHPVDQGSRATLNSLREAYASWQDEAGRNVVEFGRINVRNGPAYGYNPTDFLRDGALRSVTTVDPLALRENRLGAVMVRAQRLWTGGSASIALVPKVASSPSDKSLSLDVGATNHRDRMLLTLGVQPTDKVSGQLLAYTQRGVGTQLGASMTALLSDAAVGFVEWSGGRDQLPATTPLVEPGRRNANRLATGLTYTTAARLSLTAEVEYNGFAADRGAFARLGSVGPLGVETYLVDAQRRQDNASRKAYLLYATQQGGLGKNIDVTGLIRVNGDDHSRLAWIEIRHHWPKLDLALQWQHAGGRAISEYGVLPERQIWQLLVAYYFH